MTIKELFIDIKESGNCMDFNNFYQVWFEEDVDDIDINDITDEDLEDIEIGWRNFMDDECEDYFETLGEFYEEGNWENK